MCFIAHIRPGLISCEEKGLLSSGTFRKTYILFPKLVLFQNTFPLCPCFTVLETHRGASLSVVLTIMASCAELNCLFVLVSTAVENKE